MSLEVKKKDGESPRSLVRRFTRAVRRSGILSRVKDARYFERPLSKSKKKKKALRGLEIQKEREEMRKLGKRLRR